MVRFIVTLRKHLELNECQWCYLKDPISALNLTGVRLIIAFGQRRQPRGQNAKRKQGANCFGVGQLTQEWRSSGKAWIEGMVRLGNWIQFNNEVTEA